MQTSGFGPASGHRGRFAAAEPFVTPLPDPPVPVEETAFMLGDLRTVRAVVAGAARRWGLPEARVADLILAAGEVAANSIRHGGGRGTMRIWQDEDAAVCEIRDAGFINKPLAGREPPQGHGEGGYGLWLANQVCDLVQVRSSPAGTTIRLYVRATTAWALRPSAPGAPDAAATAGWARPGSGRDVDPGGRCASCTPRTPDPAAPKPRSFRNPKHRVGRRRMTIGGSVRELISAWPVVHQRDGDRGARGSAARSERSRDLRPRIADADRVVRSICPYCAVGCGQRVYVQEGKVTQIEGDPDSPISRGRLCPKGAASRGYVTSPLREYRVKYRRPFGTEWEELPLDQAMGMIADRIIAARKDTWEDKDSEGRTLRRSMGVSNLGGATLDNEENYTIKKLMTALGFPQVENQARI